MDLCPYREMYKEERSLGDGSKRREEEKGEAEAEGSIERVWKKRKKKRIRMDGNRGVHGRRDVLLPHLVEKTGS